MAKKIKAKKETGLYMLECISIHKIRYCVEADEKSIREIEDGGWDYLEDIDVMVEFSQDHVGERVIAVQPISDKETYLKMFDEDNAYLARWDDEKKMEFINKKFKK